MTSIEWLWEQIDGIIPYQDIKTSQILYGVLEQAKEMHEQEIIDAFKSGLKSAYHQDYTIVTQDNQEGTKSGQYYQETFVSKGNDKTPKCTCNVYTFICQIHGTSDGKTITAF